MVVQAVVTGTARATTVAAKTGVKAGQTAVKAGRTSSQIAKKGVKASSQTSRAARLLRHSNRQSSVQRGRAGIHTHNISPYQAGRTYSKVQHTIKKATSVVKGLSLTWQLIWFYPMQLLFAFIAYAAYSALYREGFFWGIFLDVGGHEAAFGVFLTAWILNLALGSGLLLYSAVMSNMVYNMKVWRYPMVLLMFCICLWGYWAPYFPLMFVPWTIVWIWCIVFAQK